MVVKIIGQALRTSDRWCGTAVGLGRCGNGGANVDRMSEV
jgi:hypothetical protein